MRATCVVCAFVMAGAAVVAPLAQATEPAPGAVAQSIGVQAAGIPNAERRALLDLYISTNGAGWTNKTNWNGAAGTECTWFGVTCDDGATTVQYLGLSNNNLTGSLPTTLGNLTNLQFFYLSTNKLAGSIPTQLGSLSKLQYLWLNGNKLTGSIPTQLGNLTSLQHLDLGDNQLSGGIPTQLGNLTNLQDLSLYANQLTGSIPTALGNLANLQDLELYSNHLTGSIPTQLGSLSNLVTLGLEGNQLTGSIPTQLGSLTNLQYLDLDTNQLTGSIPTQLGSLTSLQGLFLHTNQLSGSIPTALAGLSNLTYIQLFANQLTGPIPPQLGSLPNLQYLELYGNQLSGPIPVELGNLTQLRALSLEGNQFTGAIPTVLGSLTDLVALNLWGNQLTGPIPSEFGNLTNLQYLYLNGNMLSGAVPTSLEGLVLLVAGQSDLSYNALYSTDATLTAFLNGKQVGGNWQSTQTVAPAGVAAGATTNTSVSLSWTPIAYTGNTGAYQAFYSTTSGGPYASGGVTSDKSASSIVVGGLNAATLYYFAVRTVTNPNGNNHNTVTSDASAEVYAATAGGTCTSPSITTQPQSQSIASGQTATLSVTATGTTPLSYQWYQGASTDTSQPVGTNASGFTTPALTTTTSYWVQVSNSCGQAASAAATVTVAPTSDVWVPVASHNPGKNQSQWRSDLGLLNTGAVAANVQIKFYGTDGVVSTTTSVPPQTQAILVDVVNQIPAANSGALEILSDQPLKVTGRSYNQVSSGAPCYPNGTQGQDYPAVVSSDGLSATQSGYLGGLSETSSTRCNVGVVNTGTETATVLVELFDGAGTKLTEYPVVLVAGQWSQETQPFRNKAGQTAMDRGYAKITVQSGSGVFGFASVVDGVTNDPTTVTMARSAPVYDIWVPVASHNPGKNQSQWRSDLGLLNTGAVAANVQIKFYGSGGVVSTTTSVPAQSQAILVDVVSQIPASNSGALEIVSDQALNITARSYNQVSSGAPCYPSGTQGQDYPAVVSSDGLSALQSAYLAGLSENPTYRCNIGVVNTGTETATVLVELFDGAGTKLTEYPVTLAQGQWAQETQPFFGKAGQTAMDRGYARITVQSGSGVFGFASVVDGVTNDPTTVTMHR
ncbi:MAG: leucine-rich repeat domain-containing protein [Acidobacteriia bacterium]|nr:leucine-rich repeat domain-containing protein [Terriglobia bacterium]